METLPSACIIGVGVSGPTSCTVDQLHLLERQLQARAGERELAQA